ncbi:MAG: hypothetical protein CVT67_06410 [Actinobacteria bacterium HGW-Actinobacteria-7]|jgi:hypothetical protein|nr:MAG: hypothetical protein CVT67_06410 [Actinobacteria bacterium HGW-Actinobacteria-7]
MRKTAIVLIALLVALAVVVVFLLSSPDAQDLLKGHKTISSAAQIDKLVIGWVGNPYTDDYQNSRIAGYMQNNSTQKLSKVNIEIELLDSKGNRKEIVKYTLENVLPGQRKSFDANAGTLDGSRNAKVKITSVEVVK